MPKMKTNSGAKKRFKVTATGKVKRAKANKSHILTTKTTKRKRNLRKSTIVDSANMDNMKRLLPNSF
jgi:large subunit ribosomal protein L35